MLRGSLGFVCVSAIPRGDRFIFHVQGRDILLKWAVFNRCVEQVGHLAPFFKSKILICLLKGTGPG